MRKFLALCVLFSMLLFVAPVLIADVNEVDLGSNLSFTFEPSSTIVKPLTIIPFPNVDLSLLQEEPTESKSADVRAVVFGIGATLIVIWAVGHTF